MADLDHNAEVTDEELAGLADGSLDPARRAMVQAAVDASPRLQAVLAVQRSVVDAIGAATGNVHATHDLRERLASQAAPARARAKRRLGWLGALAGVAAATLLVLVFLPSGAGGPTVAKAADVAALPPNQPAPKAAQDKLLETAVDGVQFPDYVEKFGWRAVGTRVDKVAGRPLTTVTYEKDGRQVSYAIVSGDALDVPDGETVTVEETALRVLQSDGRSVVTWERQGHTCVLVGTDVDEATLTELAGWKGKGAIAF